jgi:hypothetical protein
MWLLWLVLGIVGGVAGTTVVFVYIINKKRTTP